MCRRAEIARSLVAALVSAVLVATPGRIAHGGPAAAEAEAPTDDALLAELEQLYARGEERFAAGDLAGAIEAFDAGRTRRGDDRPRRLHANFAVSLAIALLDRHDRDGAAPDLHRAHALLRATVDDAADVLAREPRLEALARRNLARVDAELEASTDAPEPASPPANDRPSPSDAATAPPPSPPPDPRRARDRTAAIALLVSGTALVVGGIAVVIDGATLERRARAIAEDPPMGAQKRYIEEEVPRLAAIRYAIAGPALAVGVGLLVGGGLLLRRAARPRPVVLAPVVQPRRLGLGVRGRF